MTVPPSRRFAVVGKTGSGKTEWIRRNLVEVLPRNLILDRTGEWPEHFPDAWVASGYAQTLNALQQLSPRPRWNCISYCDASDVERLMQKLVPLARPRESPCAKLGGMSIVLDEIHTHMSVQSAGAMQLPYRVGRHAGLTIIASDQRPSRCNKEVFAGIDALVIFRLTTFNDREYLRDELEPEIADRALDWANSADYRYAIWYPNQEMLEECEADPRPGTEQTDEAITVMDHVEEGEDVTGEQS